MKKRAKQVPEYKRRRIRRENERRMWSAIARYMTVTAVSAYVEPEPVQWSDPPTQSLRRH